MAGRWWNATIAACVLVALVAQVVVAVHVPATPTAAITGTLRGTDLGGRIVRVLSFFTIESNVITGVLSAVLALRPRVRGAAWNALRLTGLTGITVTGIVYSAVLSDIHEPNGAAETLVNTLVHYVVPAMALLGWVLLEPRRGLTFRTLPWALVFPVAWIIGTAVRGTRSGWYPYPFVDVGALGWARVAENGLLVVVLIVAVAALYCLADRYLPAPWVARRSTRRP